ncbi:helix-turn-helix domain-containing protein [Hansschlegelia quercus]|uniref:XRE family transcriptional regulator n=1 Tax=Hansschlegelia quercus TaxID=2528245 RepID=A0A4V2JEC9_9HYPH|nr:helix-turn-helix domain-containing protein [Hansschlegelia quercus]TBN54766.1 XRE family transcriptional regulator [Hansschlegelia quercus]
MQQPLSPSGNSRAKDEAPADQEQHAADQASLGRSVGETIKQIRIRRGLTLTDLARASDISPGMLSRVENGRTAASLSLLDRICVSLGADLAGMFREVEVARRGIRVIRLSDMPLVKSRRSLRAAEIRRIAQTTLGAVSMEALRVTVAADARAPAKLDCAGRGLIYLLSGQAELTVDGVAVVMGAGDALDISVPAILPVRAISGDATLLSFALVE